MNILFLFDRPIIAHQGGVERVSSILALQFKALGHETKYLCYSDADFSSDQQYFSCEQLFLKRSLDDSVKIDFLTKLFNQHEISIVIDQVQLIDICSIIKSLPNAPLIISVFHNQPFAHYGKEHFLMKNYYPTSLQGKLFKWACLILPSIAQRYYTDGNRRCFKSVLQYANRLCFLSERFIPRFSSIYGECDSSNLIAVNNPNTFVPSETIDFSHKEKLIIIVGRVYNLSKNMFDFLKAWNKISLTNNDWRAMVVGDGPDLNRLQQYASKYNIKRLEFVGNQVDVKPYFRKASISCVTSINEGWAMVIPEAMSQGCIPLVYDSFESVHDFISDGNNGFITPRFDVDAMAKKIQLLIDDKQRRISMGHNAIESINRFNPDVIAKEWLKIFNTLKH